MPFAAIKRIKRKWLPLALIGLYTFCLFWFGRLSAQIGILERISFSVNQVPSIESPSILPSTYLLVLIMTKAENLGF